MLTITLHALKMGLDEHLRAADLHSAEPGGDGPMQGPGKFLPLSRKIAYIRNINARSMRERASKQSICGGVPAM